MYRKLLVPVDGSPTSDRGLHEAIGLAASESAELVLLHVLDDYSMWVQYSSKAKYQEMLKSLRNHGEELLARARKAATDAGVPAETLLRETVQPGRVADAIIEETSKMNCDLIVMGTHGRRGPSPHTMGSDSQLVALGSPVPVMLVRLLPPARHA